LAVVLLGATAIPAAAASDPFAEGCPPKTLEEGASAGLNHNPAAKKAIVPTGATSLRICRYWGFGNESGKQTPKTQARAGTLNDQAEVKNRALLEGLTYEFKELNPAPKGSISCPFDDGTELYAIFFYPHAEPVIVHVSLSGCRFAGGATPRAREMTGSLERKLVRLSKGEHVKAAPEKPAVKEKGIAEEAPPRVTVAFARHQVKEDLDEDCADFCACWKLITCTRKTAAAVSCGVEATLESGKVCRSALHVKKLEGGLVEISGGGSDEGPCAHAFLPPEIRESMEEREKEEAQEAERGKRSSRATGQSPRRT
jgi:hypothetical protein